MIHTAAQARRVARRVSDARLLVSVLLHHQQILGIRAHWTRVALARTSTFEPVLPLSERAWCWSLSGGLALALFQVLGVRKSQADWQRLYDLAVDILWDALPPEHPRSRQHGRDLDGFNDYVGTDYLDVIRLIDQAVQSATTRADALVAAAPAS